VLDGKLDEPVYKTVGSISDLVQQDPSPGAPATEKTEVWFFFDDTRLYISARCWDSHPERDVADDMRHDGSNITSNENLGVALDTFHDRRNGFGFTVSSIGGMNE